MTLSDVPTFTMRQLLEAGVHFGHQTHRWNPKMAPFIYGARNNIHIMDLRETAPMLQRALVRVRDEVSRGGRVLFVGTKRQASGPLTDAAKACGQYYVNHRWLGGMLTNWRTISNSIKRLRTLEDQLAEETSGLTKKELLQLTRERDKLERALGGIKEMGGLPAVLFVIDTNKEEIAIQEAKKLNIPVIAVVDSNCDPDKIDFPIPGNDDAARAISLYLDLISRSVIAGLQQERRTDGEDLGAAEELPIEEVTAAEEVTTVEEVTVVEEAVAEAVTESVTEAEAAPEAAPGAVPEATVS
ncbi:MAG: 30S ribosomal protein S2 [Alphaproteobacteria bacterium]|nr:30S ribosomal protein S2 [Alphaproteobacteria bacterium]MDP7055597.1 30S ribosomal protein S2 [Alphaproteobacteria bacterium]HJM92617.1 30S ribosomal protein S2 [Alphaproteobacteria bacterium]